MIPFRDAALDVLKTRYPDAECAFAGGSVARGEATATSDIDLVVVFAEREFAHRESFTFQDWPIEAYLHDPKTLQYFFVNVDAPSGIPSLMRMVQQGIPLPEASDFTTKIKTIADDVIEQGPPRLSKLELTARRYAISDAIDDLRAPRSSAEITATAAKLYEDLGDFFHRARGEWSSKGKHIPRGLIKASPAYGNRFIQAFDACFSKSETSLLVALAAETLGPYGGFLFDGYERSAPRNWRS